MGVRSRWIAGHSLALILAGAAPVHAEQTDAKALAEQLFEQARDLAKANRWADACPKFEASLRYDAQLGTRLNLATCYEKVGKLASAWGLFRDSADLARTAGDTVRRDFALKQAAALQPRLPKLTISGPTIPQAGFVVTRDGQPLDIAALGSALYVDPGPHEVVASAPGFEPFKAQVTLVEGQSQAVVLKELVPLKNQTDPGKVAPKQPPGDGDDGDGEPLPPPDDPGKTRRIIGISSLAGGLAIAGAGLFFGMRATAAYDDAKTLCGASLVCENEADFARGRDLVDTARSRATLSTVLVVGGAAIAAAGAVVWITAPKPRARERARTEAAVVPVATDRELGVSLVGRF